MDTGLYTQKIKTTIAEIMETDIPGCITGSCMLEEVNFDTWDSAPDIDLFVYNKEAMVYAITLLMYKLGFTPGGKDKKEAGQRRLIDWLINDKMGTRWGVSTIMLQRDGVYVNVSLKKEGGSYCDDCMDVIKSFDMSIIMVGQDIRTGTIEDLRGENHHIATPNCHRELLNNHPSRFDVDRALRQWDRVLKYWGRGYDTRPMAKFYIDLIDEVLEAGSEFGTENDELSFKEMEPGFTEMREKISAWLEDKKDVTLD